jgi:predicted RND superfamily exporter protein
MVSGSLVAKDGTSTIVLFHFQSEADVKEVAERVYAMVQNLDLPESIYFAGMTFLTSYVADIISTDMIKLIPISFLLIALILFLSFHSLQGVILPLLSAGLAIVWAVGSFVLMGFKLSMVSNNVPIIILAVGSAYSIHVFNRINQSGETDNGKAIISALRMIALPVFLAGLTTMVGFLSFIFGAYLSMIRDFGILAALGTFYSAAFALILVPALLAIRPSRKTNNPETSDTIKEPLMKKYLLTPLYKMNIAHPKRIVTVWIVLGIVGIAGVTQVKRSVSVSDYFKVKHPASVADRIMEGQYGGSKPVFVVFKGDVQSPEVLKGMADFSDYLLESPYVTSTQSIADVVIKLNVALGSDERIPSEKATIQQLWFIIGQQDLSQLVTEDLDQAIVLAKFNNQGQANTKKFTAYTDKYLNEHKSDAYTVEITGMPYVNAQMDKSLIRSQITSLLIAILLVIALVSLIFKSAVEGLYAATPIVATIAILYGFMGFTGIPLNVVTVLVASVAMGIGIDYSIHYISNFNLSLKKGQNLHMAVEEAVMVSGKAIFINFASVSAGFLVLAFSDLMPMVYFGVLIALSMLGSAMGALTLLPAIILLGKRRKF